MLACMQAAYGKSALAATSFFTYVGLGLGFLASTLSLPFGVFVLLCQREPVRYIQVLHGFPILHLPRQLPLLHGMDHADYEEVIFIQ